MKKIKKIEAQKMRRKGYSLGEISKKLGISKSTASLWTKDEVVSVAGLKRIAEIARKSRARGHETLHHRKLDRLEIANMEAKELLQAIELNQNAEIIALSMMYYCEGIKNDNGVVFTNSNPELVRAFISMLYKIFKIDIGRIQVCLHLHDYHNENESLRFWSKYLKISASRFSIYRKQSNHKYSKKGYRGCVRVSYFNSHIARVILSFAKNFIKLYI